MKLNQRFGVMLTLVFLMLAQAIPADATIFLKFGNNVDDEINFFGSSIAVSGDDALIGDPSGGATGTGHVFYHQKGGDFTALPMPTPAPKSGDNFGFSVAISGNFAVVGAPEDDTVSSGAGAVYFYKWNGSTWAHFGGRVTPSATPNSSFYGAKFGQAVDIIQTGTNQAFAIVGSHRDSVKGTNSGAFYMYEIDGAANTVTIARNPINSDIQIKRFTPPDLVANDYLGGAVAISETSDGHIRAFVGAIGADNGPDSMTGAVYVYDLDTNTWQTLLASDAALSDQFGNAVSASGDDLIVGAEKANLPAKNDAGKAYIFRFNAGTGLFEEQAKLSGEDGGGADPNDRFGGDVSISGNYALIGAEYRGVAGEAYLFNRSGETWSLHKNIAYPDATTNAQLGAGVGISVDPDAPSNIFSLIGVPEQGNGAQGAVILDTDPANPSSNFAPIITGLSDIFIRQEPGASAIINFMVDDVEDSASGLQSVTRSIVNNGNGLLTEGSVVLSGSGATRTLNITPVSGRTGVATISISATDSQNAITTITFTVTVNFPPEITNLTPPPPITINESTVDQQNSETVNFTVSDPQGDVNGVVITATSSNQSVVPNSGLIPGGAGASRSVTISPTVNRTGAATITLRAIDTDGNPSEFPFVVQVNGGPQIVSISPTSPTVDEDNTIQMTAAIRDIEGGTVTLTAKSENPDLVANAAGPDQIFTPVVRTLDPNQNTDFNFSITPEANRSGTVDIVLTATDAGGSSSSSTFTLTVTPVNNDSPEIVDITLESESIIGQTIEINEAASTGQIFVSISHPDAIAKNIIISAESLNKSVIPDNFGGTTYIDVDGSDSAQSEPKPVPPGQPLTIPLEITAPDNSMGETTIAVRATTDGTSDTVTKQFTVRVNSLNDKPIMEDLAPRTIYEDDPSFDLEVTVTDPDGDNIGIIPMVFNYDPAFILQAPEIIDEQVFNGGAGVTRTFRFQPVPNANGTSEITVAISDPGGEVASQTFTLEIIGQDDEPEIDPIDDQSINEDLTLIFDVNINVDDFGSANLAFAAADTTLVPAGNITVGTLEPETQVTITPAADANGVTTITATLTDVAGREATQTFNLTVNAVNDAPTIAEISDQTTPEDTPKEIEIVIGDKETPPANLTVEVTPTAPSSPLLDSITVLGAGTNRKLTITPALDQNGVIEMTVRVRDTEAGIGGVLTATETFFFTVTPVPDPPDLADIQPKTVAEDTALPPFNITVTSEGDIDDVSITAVADNTTLLPTTNISITGSGSTRQVTITPAANQFGQTLVTVTARDANNLTDEESFLLTVTNVNDPPTISIIGNQTVAEDATLSGVAFTVSDPENDPLTISATSSNTTILANTDIQISGTGGNRTLSLKPRPNAFGDVTVTVTANDGNGGTDQESFTLSVTPVGDAPQISGLLAVYVTDEEQQLNISGFTIVDPDVDTLSLALSLTAAGNEVFTPQGLNINYNGIDRGPVYAVPTNQGVPTGEIQLNVTPVKDQADIQEELTLTVTDDGGLETTRTFQVYVQGVNDSPTITGDPPTEAIVGELYTFTPFANDPEDGTAGLSFTTTGNRPPWMSINTTDGTISGTPQNIHDGEIYNFSIVAMDSGTPVGQSSLPVMITVSKIEAVPRINNGAGITSPKTTAEDTPLIFTFDVRDKNGDSLTVTPSIVEPATPQLVKAAGVKIFRSDTGTEVVGPIATQPDVPVSLEMRITPEPNANSVVFPETTTIRVTVADEGTGDTTVAQSSFVVNVTQVVDKAVIKDLSNNVLSVINASITEGGEYELNFKVEHKDGGELTLTATSSNTSVLPNANIDIGPDGGSEGIGPQFLTAATGETGNLELVAAPLPDASGSTRITLTVAGSQADQTATASIILSISPEDDAPTIVPAQPTWTLDEGTSASFDVTIGDPDGDDVRLEIASSNTTVMPVGPESILIDGNPYTVGGFVLQNSLYGQGAIPITVIPADFQSTPPGTPLTLTLTVTDTDTLTNVATVAVQVNPVPDAPTLQFINSQLVDEDQQIDVPLTMSDPDGETLIVSVASSKEALVRSSDIRLVVGGSTFLLPQTVSAAQYNAGNIFLRITPVPGQNSALQVGPASITVTLTDPTNRQAERSFGLTVDPVEDPPSINDVPTSDTMNEDATLEVAFSVNDPDGGELLLKVTSSQPAIVPNNKNNLTFSGQQGVVGTTLTGASFVQSTITAANGSTIPVTLTIKPDQFQNGSLILTFELSDGNTTVTDTMNLTINSINNPPAITNLFTQSVSIGESVQIPFNVTDPDTPTPTVTALSGNTGVIPNDDNFLKVERIGGTDYRMTITPLSTAQISGSQNVTITVRANDGQQEVTQALTVTVFPKNSPAPEIFFVPDGVEDDVQVIQEDGTAMFNFYIQFDLLEVPTEEPADFNVIGLSARPELILSDNVTPVYVNSSDASRHNYQLNVTPLLNAASQTGSDTVDVFVIANVGGFTTSKDVTILIEGVNDRPVVTPEYTSPVVTTAGSPATVRFRVSDAETAANNLIVDATWAPAGNNVIQSKSLNCTDGNCELILTPVANTGGQILNTQVNIEVRDEAGATPLSPAFFSFQVEPNQRPFVTISQSTYQTGISIPLTIPFTVGDQNGGTLQLTVTQISGTAGLLDSFRVSYESTGTTIANTLGSPGTVVLPGTSELLQIEVVPNIGIAGSLSLRVEVKDATQETASDSFTLIVSTPGDLDDDGFTDLSDAIVGLKVLTGVPVPSLEVANEVNNDDRVGLEEVIYILRKVAGLI